MDFLFYLFIFTISNQEVFMTYQQFLTEIQLQIHSLFDTDVTIQLHKIQKNNGVTLDGLTILQKGCNISPTIYLIITKNIRQEKAYITLFYISGKFTGLTVPAALSM